MAKFELELPTEIMKDIKTIYDNSSDIFGRMTRAGAEVVKDNVRANMPEQLRKSNIAKNLKVTVTYKTPSDGGINTSVGFYGYFTNEDGKETPAPLVGNMFEYGSSKKEYPRQPFLRKSFRKKQIEEAMLKEQKRASGGILDDE